MPLPRNDICVVVPTFNNAQTLGGVLDALAGFFVVVVNDGSTDATAQMLQERASRAQGGSLEVVTHSHNRGKGRALQTGFERARERGFSHAVTFDADGQHRVEDIDCIIDADASGDVPIEKHPNNAISHPLVVGRRELRQPNKPWLNVLANRMANFCFWLQTGRRLADTQSGLRLYSLEWMRGMRFRSEGYGFEFEVLVRVSREGVEIVEVPIEAIYTKDGRVTHFRPVRDVLRIAWLNVVLLFEKWRCRK